jgi:DNA-binding NtrC family response regulator
MTTRIPRADRVRGRRDVRRSAALAPRSGFTATRANADPGMGTGMTTALIGKQGAAATKARVAVVTAGGASGLAAGIARLDHEVTEFTGWSELAEKAETTPFDLVLFDEDLAASIPGHLECPALAVSERGDVSRLGAVSTSLPDAALEPLLALAVELRTRMNRCAELEHLVEGIRSGSAMVGRSPVMRRLQSALSRAADCDASVLIEGPAGSGKSLAARMIHCKSRRSNRPIQTADCAEIDQDAITRLLDQARGTTLVLEDVDRLPANAQSVLVRHLKERAPARPEAGTTRLIVTTSAHLPELVARGAFREDLYYRLHAFPVVVPSLRERPDDVPLLAEAILASCAALGGRSSHGFTPAAVILLESMQWPGNVAQLETVVRRAQALAAGGPIDREHLVAPAQTTSSGPSGAPSTDVEVDSGDAELSEAAIRPFDEEEQRLLSRALRATKGNVRRAAQLLGIGRATLYRKIQQYRLRLQ